MDVSYWVLGQKNANLCSENANKVNLLGEK